MDGASGKAEQGEENYRGRLAPSPTGLLHLGHARTFWIAQQRAGRHGGALVLRIEDLDRSRCRPEFTAAVFDDLRWFGFQWQEGPDGGGGFAPYSQSERTTLYLSALQKLQADGFVYPCACSRQDVLRALQAPHAQDDDPLYPGTCRPVKGSVHRHPSAAEGGGLQLLKGAVSPRSHPGDIAFDPGRKINWRFRVPDGETIAFVDGYFGPQRFVAGEDFGDFVVWRHDSIPAYHLAVVVDDAAMKITEVVRGEDLLKSTARQLLLYRALALPAPRFFHCPLVTDESGARLAKRNASLSLRSLRASGADPRSLRQGWNAMAQFA